MKKRVKFCFIEHIRCARYLLSPQVSVSFSTIEGLNNVKLLRRRQILGTQKLNKVGSSIEKL